MGKSDLAGCDLAGAHLVHSAAKGGNGAILQTLLDRGGDETAVTSVGRTCLHYAAHGESGNQTCTLPRALSIPHTLPAYTQAWEGQEEVI